MLEARRESIARCSSHGRPAFSVRSIPFLARLGALVILAGLAVDLTAHVGPFASPGLAQLAHWTVLAGMVVALVGVIGLAVKTERRMR